MEQGWERERPPRLALSAEQLQELVAPAFPGRRIAEHEVLSTGLANTNVRFRLHGRTSAYVLRLHTRDPAAAGRERALMRYLASHPSTSPPVPPLVYSDPRPGQSRPPYSIWGFVDGTLLQHLFRTLPPAELVAIAGVCGTTLAALSAHSFPICGELGPELEIVRQYGPPSRFLPAAVHRALFEGRAGARLGAELRDALWQTVERTAPRLRCIDGRYALVHGDYKRSNLLVRRSGASWELSAVLDWEFAFAGPPLIDVGLFLRAGEALPEGFRDAFAAHYRAAGGALPLDWLPLSRLVDVLSQVTFLDAEREAPCVFAETIEVLEETLRVLS